MSSRFSRWTPVALLIAFALLISAQTHAATLTSTEFWATPIQNFVDTLVGPVSFGMILIGFVGGIWSFVRCGEINGFTRAMMVMTICGSILLATKPFISGIFGI